MASVAALAERYFSTLNPLAEKISGDVDEAPSAYEAMWGSLTDKERVEIINESLIKPELALKYTALDTLDFDINDPPFFRKNDLMSFFGREHGRRVVHDDSATYRDEHSAPFMYHTRSQLNLCELSGSRNKEEEKGNAPPVMSELVLSHSKLVSELKSALKTHDALKKEPPTEQPVTSPGGFISKIMSKKLRGKGEKECLVPQEPSVQVFACDVYFRSELRSAASPRGGLLKSGCGAGASDAAEESRGLLCGASGGSSAAELRSSGELRAASADTLTDPDSDVPKTGYDFLDNW